MFKAGGDAELSRLIGKRIPARASIGIDKESLYDLAQCYYEGIGTEKDYKEAYELNLQDAYLGCKLSPLLVGTMTANGLGTFKDEVEGLAWLYVGGAEGDINALPYIRGLESRCSPEQIMRAKARAKVIDAVITKAH